MDPNVCLAELLELANQRTLERDDFDDELPDELSNDDILDISYDLAAGIEALDEWLRSGGFLPERWRR